MGPQILRAKVKMNSTTSPHTDMASLLGAFRFTDADELQDYLSALVLSECVYKAVDAGPAAALAAITVFRDQFPAQTVGVTAVQFSRKRVSHKYLLATGGGAMYACFMGTKELRDVAADAAVRHRAVWGEVDGSDAAAHGGFLARADGIPVESLYLHATRQGLRLVLCGHSLGGAVAILATLRLLRLLGSQPDPRRLCCVCFGTPALGNAALAAHVAARGWGPHFRSYCLPEDPVPRLLLLGGANRGAAAAAPLAGQSNSATVAQATAALEEAVYAEDARDVGPPELEEEEQGKQRGFGRLNSLPQPAPLLVRTLGSLRALRPSPFAFPFPVYSHFGSQLYLCAAGVEESAPSSPASFLTPANMKVGNWLSHHRMGAYRGRTLEICSLASRSSRPPRPEGPAAAAEEALLAPAVAPAAGMSLLPVLWSAAPEDQLPASRDLWARLKRRETGLPAAYSLEIDVFGSGLQWCTAALLQLPSPGAPVPGRVAANYAKEKAIAALRQQAELQPPRTFFSAPPHSRSGSLRQKAAAALQAARAFSSQKLRQLQERVSSPRQQQSRPAAAAPRPELVLEFSDVPTAALLALRVGADGALPPLSLSLFTDFARVETAVALRATSVWMVGLSDAARLRAVQQLWQHDQQQQQVSSSEVVDEGNEEERKGARSFHSPHTLAGRAWQPEPPSALPATLLRGMMVTDVSAAAWVAADEGPLPSSTVGTTAAAAARLHALADLLTVKATEGGGEGATRTSGSEDFELWEELEAEDELFTPHSELGAGAKLRRLLRRALVTSSSSARRRRRHSLQLLAKTPAPAVIVIVAAGEDLIARSSYSEPGGGGAALDEAVLGALSSAAAAAAKCRAVVLVAVAAPEARDAAWRRRLSFLSGLHGRPGAVVPLGEAGEGAPLLQEAVLAHAAALQAERALQASEREKVASSVLRARL